MQTEWEASHELYHGLAAFLRSADGVGIRRSSDEETMSYPGLRKSTAIAGSDHQELEMPFDIALHLVPLS